MSLSAPDQHFSFILRAGSMSLIPVGTDYDLRITTHIRRLLGTSVWNRLAGKTPENQGQTSGNAVVDRNRNLATGSAKSGVPIIIDNGLLLSESLGSPTETHSDS